MTQQEIIPDYPPLFDEIDRVFRVRGRSVVFSFGPRIYNPDKLIIPPAILAHEAVHGARQGESEAQVLDWWYRYLDDPYFRLAEELPAHQAEYRHMLSHGSRAERRKALKQVAAKLAAPLYGSLVTPKRARLLLSKG